MKHSEVLIRAWNILIGYKALWLFGLILALTTSSVSGGQGSAFYNLDEDEYRDRGLRLELDLKPGDNIIKEIGIALNEEMDHVNEELDRFFFDVFETDIDSDIQKALITILWVGLALLIVAKVLRYISETALIRMVDRREEKGELMSIGQGFRLGWSRAAWRIFLIDLTFGFPIFVLFLAMIALVVVSVFSWIGGTGSVFYSITAFGLLFLAILAVIPVGIVLGFLKPFIRRACALNELGVFAAIREGYQVVRQNLRDVGLMWLIMLGIGLCWVIVIIPVFMVVAISALSLGIFAGFAVGALTGILWGAIAGVVVFLLILVVPLSFLDGLREVFYSSTWTITFRELQPMANLETGELVEIEA